MLELKWKDISRDRRLALHPDNFYVIVPEKQGEAVPFACPVCEYPMRTADDAASYREFTCCQACTHRWAQSRADDWKDGWRPAQEEIEEESLSRICRIPRFSV